MKQIVITKPNNLEEEINSGAMLRLAGVSERLSGAKNIHLAIATVPKDRCSTTHFHTNCESAIYVLSGRGLFLHGENMEIEAEISEGDFIYVPAGALHQPVNTGEGDLKLIVSVHQSEADGFTYGRCLLYVRQPIGGQQLATTF